MFNKETYIQRRAELKKTCERRHYIIVWKQRIASKFTSEWVFSLPSGFRRFLYYFGQQRDGLVGVIDVNDNKEILIGNDIDIEDIVWFGSVDAVSDLAAQVGVSNSAPMSELKTICE